MRHPRSRSWLALADLHDLAGPRGGFIRGADGLDGGDREHAWFQAEFVGGLRLSSTLLGAW